MKFKVRLTTNSGESSRRVQLERSGEGWRVLLDGRPVDADVVEVDPDTISVLLDGRAFEFHLMQAPDGALKLQAGLQEFSVRIVDPRAWRGRRHGAVEATGRQQIIAPMPGRVVRVLVKAGDRVETGQGLFVVEAMKMQNEIRSPKSGTVERLLAAEGQAVNAGEVLAWVD